MPEQKKYWYAVYTKPRSEKQVYKRLSDTGIDSFLPLQKTLRQWSDRKKMVEILLFTSYVFVHIDTLDHEKVLKTNGVVKYVSFEGKAAAIPQDQIDNLKLIVDSNAQIEVTHKRLKPGQYVEVTHGTLRGLRGELIKTSHKHRLLVRIDTINQNLLVNIPEYFLQSVS
ncbi:Transcription antitermination protein RfaH [subsurface metagenome]